MARSCSTRKKKRLLIMKKYNNHISVWYLILQNVRATSASIRDVRPGWFSFYISCAQHIIIINERKCLCVHARHILRPPSLPPAMRTPKNWEFRSECWNWPNGNFSFPLTNFGGVCGARRRCTHCCSSIFTSPTSVVIENVCVFHHLVRIRSINLFYSNFMDL